MSLGCLKIAACIAFAGSWLVVIGAAALGVLLLVQGYVPAGLIMLVLSLMWVFVARAWARLVERLEDLENERRNLRE